MPEHPGGRLARRPLQFIYIVDCSGSMSGKKIETVNLAIKESISAMCSAAEQNPQAEVFVRAITFSDGARWHISQPTEIHSFRWGDLDADGVTDMGEALERVADALKMENMPERGLPPVLLLLSDGQPTDNFEGGLKRLLGEPWGKRAVRIAIGIGDDADLDVLQKFIANNEIKALQARNIQELVDYIRWGSIEVLRATSTSATRSTMTAGKADTPQVHIPAPPPGQNAASPADVF